MAARRRLRPNRRPSGRRFGAPSLVGPAPCVPARGSLVGPAPCVPARGSGRRGSPLWRPAPYVPQTALGPRSRLGVRRRRRSSLLRRHKGQPRLPSQVTPALTPLLGLIRSPAGAHQEAWLIQSESDDAGYFGGSSKRRELRVPGSEMRARSGVSEGARWPPGVASRNARSREPKRREPRAGTQGAASRNARSGSHSYGAPEASSSPNGGTSSSSTKPSTERSWSGSRVGLPRLKIRHKSRFVVDLRSRSPLPKGEGQGEGISP